MSKVTYGQIQRIFGKLNALKETAWRDEYVSEASQGRVQSVADLSVDEAHVVLSLLSDVEQGLRQPCNPVSDLATRFKEMPHTLAPVINETEAQKSDRLRKKILKCCHDMGWYARNPEDNTIILNKNNRPQLDYDHINNFCLTHSKYKKKLNDHTVAELSGNGGLVFQFQTVARNTINREQKPWTKPTNIKK